MRKTPNNCLLKSTTTLCAYILKNTVEVYAQICTTTLCDCTHKNPQQLHAQISTARQCECRRDNTEQHCIQLSNGNIVMGVIFSRVHDARLYLDQRLKSDVCTMSSTCCSYNRSKRKFKCKCCRVLWIEQLSNGTFQAQEQQRDPSDSDWWIICSG
jgi:hypothetical protein